MLNGRRGGGQTTGRSPSTIAQQPVQRGRLTKPS